MDHPRDEEWDALPHQPLGEGLAPAAHGHRKTSLFLCAFWIGNKVYHRGFWISAFLLFIITLVVFIIDGSGHLRSSSFRSANSAEIPTQNAETGVKMPGTCTTWPVAGDYSYNTSAANRQTKLHLDSYAPAGGWGKPQGTRVVAAGPSIY